MSGPMAAGFGLEAGVIIAAESIARGMAEVAADMEAADRQAEATRQQRRAARQQLREARQAGSEMRQQREAFRAQVASLQTVVEGQHGSAAAARVAALAAGSGSLQDELKQFLDQVGSSAGADFAAARRGQVARVLERLELDDDVYLPPALEALARDIVSAPTDARAELLITELRLQVQNYNAAVVAAAELKKRKDAAALVLEQSLKDLGYAVEDIEETLFVEGGVAHFQRAEWGDYFVRLRIDPKRSSMNFNVVRAGTTGEDRQHEDLLAEERWCSDFPKLFETLKARGIPINVTRLLQAGEAPVQVVDAASLPERGHEERPHETLKARSLP